MKDDIKKNTCLLSLRSMMLTLFFVLAFGLLSAQAQTKQFSGTVTDSNGEPLPGVTVMVQGTTIGTITDLDGKYQLNASEDAKLVFSFIGYETVTMPASNNLKVTLQEETSEIEEVVIVGYGQQKKASVVGAITQTTGKVLERAGGISNVGAALTGNLPGVVTTQGTGMPGEEDPKIVIRGQSSWNSSDPLVLVDGIERPMNSVDISSVQSISVLKDASATAVYGVKGANGVILITTKRGSEGDAKIDAGFSTTIKSPSKLPNKLDAYDALVKRNEAIEHELALFPSSWNYVRSMEYIANYRNQSTVEQQERYPNVNWQDYLFKNSAMSYNGYVNISGGTKFVKYFASADYVNEGDLFKIQDNNRGYDCGYGYQRINVRSNLDFQITKSTVFKVNIAGSNGIKNSPWSNSVNSEWQIGQQWAGAYNIAPDVFLGKYDNGAWGFYPNASNVSNSAENMSLGGSLQKSTTNINTDFALEQDLSFLTKGLSAKALISWDNIFLEGSRGINDLYNSTQHMWIDPETGQQVFKETTSGNEGFRFTEELGWNHSAGSVDNNETIRKLYYQGQINYSRAFAEKHNVGAMGLFSRSEYAKGNMIPAVREDWAFRLTYDFKGRYFLEYNGAYNGSEKFSSENRFAFFNSGAIGWLISEEAFMKSLKDNHIIEILKLRASVGQIGDDNINARWLYLTQWANNGTKTRMQLDHKSDAAYSWYEQTTLGNPNVHWETVTKQNIGLDYSFLGGLLAGSFELFKDKRTDILLDGNGRAIPNYYGATAATANLGKVETKGYELELRVEKTIANKVRLWGNFNMTHNKDKVIKKDDLALAPNYQKAEGYAIGQATAYLDNGFIETFDQVYGSPKHDVNDASKLPGDYYIVDFNSDGVIDTKDVAPVSYSSNPQNTYNATIGVEYKGFSCFAQFYGVTNVTRDVTLHSLTDYMDNVYDLGDWWTKDSDGDFTVPRWGSTVSYNDGRKYLYDGSYIRLKNLEFAYTWNSGWIKKIGLSYLKLYVNGNNLWLWTRMPDDREANLGGGGFLGAYPTVKRYNFGIKVSF